MDTEDKILQLVQEADPSNPMSYVEDIVKPLARKKLDGYISTCGDCDTCRGTKSLTYGNHNAAVMIIGESVLEEQCGEKEVFPLQGAPEWEMMQKIVSAYNINPEQLFWMNAVNCYTFKEVNGKKLKRTPCSAETAGCKIFLDYAIDVVKPNYIILLGNIALNAFEENSISKCRGEWTAIKGIPTMPTYSPTYLRQLEDVKEEDIVQEYKADFCYDIKQVFLRAQREFPESDILLSKLED